MNDGCIAGQLQGADLSYFTFLLGVGIFSPTQSLFMIRFGI